MIRRRAGRVLRVMPASLLLVPALLVPALLVVAAAPAWAHAGGLSTSPSGARVLALDPPVAGLEVRAVEFGARLRLDNGSGSTVVVEPLPGSVLSGLPVVPAGGRAYWSDPRTIAAAGAPRPPDGRLGWVVPLRIGGDVAQLGAAGTAGSPTGASATEPVGGAPATDPVGADPGGVRVLVRGEQVWPPPPSPLWWAAPLLAFLLVAGLGSGRRAGGAGLALATVTVALAHLLHVLGSAGVPEDRPYPLMLLSAAGYALLGWPLAAAGAWLARRGRPAGPLLCCAAGVLFAVVIAPVDAFTLVDAVVPFSWGADLDRALVAVTLGGGLGVATAGMAVLRSAAVPAR